jgi:hypothetical protein
VRGDCNKNHLTAFREVSGAKGQRRTNRPNKLNSPIRDFAPHRNIYYFEIDECVSDLAGRQSNRLSRVILSRWDHIGHPRVTRTRTRIAPAGQVCVPPNYWLGPHSRTAGKTVNYRKRRDTRPQRPSRNPFCIWPPPPRDLASALLLTRH